MDAIVDAISERTEHAAVTLGAVEATLSEKAGNLIEILSQSKSGLANMVEQVASNIAAADERFEQTTARFADTTAQAADVIATSSRLLDGKLEKLQVVSNETLSQVSSIVGRFGDHSKVLSQASELLGAAQSNLVGTLEERQQALRDLSVGLVKRSEEIETTMQTLGHMVEAAFERAEQRSSQVAGNLRQSIQSSFADIGKILSDTEKQAESTAGNMRNALLSAGEDANRSIEKTLSEAETRSSELANRLREASPRRLRTSIACSAKPDRNRMAPPTICAKSCDRPLTRPLPALPVRRMKSAAPRRIFARNSTSRAAN